MRGLATGFYDLDNVLGGLQKSDLVVLAARPSVGKTSIALDMARHIAKSIVGSKLANKCTVQIAYAIGIAEPVGVYVDSNNIDIDLVEVIKKNFDLRPQAIIEYLDLRKPIYEETASYGHFGRDEFPWEK